MSRVQSKNQELDVFHAQKAVPLPQYRKVNELKKSQVFEFFYRFLESFLLFRKLPCQI